LTMVPHTHGHTHTVYVSPQVSGTSGDGGRRALRQKPEEKREGEREYTKCPNCGKDVGQDELNENRGVCGLCYEFFTSEGRGMDREEVYR